MDCKIKPDMCDFLQSSVYESAFCWHPTLWKMLHLETAWHQMWASSMPDFRHLSQILLSAQLKYPLTMSSYGPFSQMESLEMWYLGKCYRKYLLHGESSLEQTYTSTETFVPKKKKRKYLPVFHRMQCGNIPNMDKILSQPNMILYLKKKNPVTSSSLHNVSISPSSRLSFNWLNFQSSTISPLNFRIPSIASPNSYSNPISTPVSVSSQPSLIPFKGRKSL